MDKLGQGRSRKAASRTLVRQALQGIHIDLNPVRCAVLLATADWCQNPANLPKEVRCALKRALSYEVPLIGGSMAKLFCSKHELACIEHGMILMLFCSRDLWVTVESLRKPHNRTEAERFALVKELAETLKKNASTRLGASASRHLLGFFPGMFVNRRGRRVYYDNELNEEILTAFNYQMRLIGGAAVNGVQPTVGYQFANDKCLTSGLALAVVETDLAWGNMMGHGFTADHNRNVSIDAFRDGKTSGYQVSVLDGKPAAQRLRELLPWPHTKQGQYLFGLPAGRGYYVVSSITSCLREGADVPRCIRLSRKARTGDHLFLLRADEHEMFRAAKAAVAGATRKTNAVPEKIKLVWGLSCTGRDALYQDLEPHWKEATAQIRQTHPQAEVVGALCGGEFGMDQWHQSQGNNFSFWVSCIASEYASRADTRLLQEKLLGAAQRLSLCETPKEVMQSALEGAMRCGAEGGQLCIVDFTLGRILGVHLGFALSRPGSGQDWAAVAALTDRPTIETKDTRFPSDLLDWSLPVDQDHDPRVVSRISREEDILTLIVRTHQAVFVTDSAKRRFHCQQKAAKAGNVITYLAIPLLGSDGRAIATLQLGFKPYSTIDRESFRLWLGFAQKLAVAFERAQEAQERTVNEAIASLGNRIMQEPFKRGIATSYWCNEFLKRVIELLGAKGAHVRLLTKTPSGDEEYRLVAAVGHLSELRFNTRPMTHASDGSCNFKLLRKGGAITNTKTQTSRLNWNVRPVVKLHPDAEEFLQGLNAIHSTAWLPLKHGDEILGSFVVDSLESYCFSERKARIVKAAAALAGAILCRKNADSDKVRLDYEKDIISEILVSATKGTAGERLKEAIEHLCKALEADVASLYLWHEPIERLVLHTAYNWYRPMEGKAKYKRGQGWTGGLALMDTPSIVCAGMTKEHPCTHNYYDAMVPPQHRFPDDEQDARIGVRLMAGGVLLGVAHFAYYRQNVMRLKVDYRHIYSLLDMLRHPIILSVEAAKRDSIAEQVRRLLNVRNTVAPRLLRDADHREVWPEILEEVRDAFRVESVSFHPVRDGQIEQGWEAVPRSLADSLASLAMAPMRLMREVVFAEKPVTVPSIGHKRLLTHSASYRSNPLFAVPVSSSQGTVIGVLRFGRRLPDKNHPFEFFDDYEQMAAGELARSLSTALEGQNAMLELRHHVEIAQKIGATTVASAVSMHRLMRHLSVLRQNIAWLRQRTDARNGDISEKVATMDRTCAQAISMIQLASNKALTDRRELNLRTLVAQAVRVVNEELTPSEDKHLSVINELDLRVQAEGFAILHALVNLLTNAITWTESGGTIDVRTAQDKNNARVQICNPGRRYTREELDKFFQPGESSRREEGHLGLGLPLAKMTIEAFGGSLALSSPESGGVEAHVCLPLSRDNIRSVVKRRK